MTVSKTQEFYAQWQFNLVGQERRVGQACFNAAHRVFGGAVDAVTGTLFDPFHDDTAIPLFLAWMHTKGIME